ncbi:MAG: N-(5-phosphoribosyl)anthranilate isomerase [Cytophagaceae bacterium]|jgi:phosphoribosylanthranilate isomerase|nr:N-(5-phosphoribosyl)anthranilate isomerase [Cytophagaceae bacterium]
MALKTNVYISDVTNLTEARYYAGMGVSIIGFNANPGDSTFASAQQFDAITSWLSGIQTAWQWHSAPSQELLDLISSSSSDLIEICTVPLPEQWQFLTKPLLIRTSSIEDLQTIAGLPSHTFAGIVWEGDPSVLPPLSGDLTLFIQTEPPFDPLDSLLDEHKGISLKGIPESRPGWNDFDQLADLLESLETN